MTSFKNLWRLFTNADRLAISFENKVYYILLLTGQASLILLTRYNNHSGNKEAKFGMLEKTTLLVITNQAGKCISLHVTVDLNRSVTQEIQ